MAQAARLSLRMQKELKLLLSDPPHGATFPDLSVAGDSAHSSSSSSSSSLTIIDAEIEGPEGTVYYGGFFKIRIQIPERYPFQPPVVTFATPIYHPNIDDGGRICLDILNLPPKGAWQPSLNVSTVITSIGLLLCEPNPDDGLMCEASREFKYNRQAFDLKARTMTEKYAKTNTSGGMVSNSQCSELQLPGQTGDIEVGHEIETDSCITNGKPGEACKKLSLDLDVLHSEKDDRQKLNTNEVHSVGDNNFCKKQKLSLSSLSQPKPNESDHQNNKVDQQVRSQSTPTSIQAVIGSKLQACEGSNPTSEWKVSSPAGNSKLYTGSKKLSLGTSFMPRNQDKCKNENIDQSKENLPWNSMKPELTKQELLRGGTGATDLNKGEFKVEHTLAKEEAEELCDHRSDNKQQPDPSLAVIVLDSDESDEEDRSRCRRSKLSLLSKRPIKL